MAHNFPKRQVIVSCTAGSTGEPLLFFSTKDEELNRGYARALRARTWAGYRLGDEIAALRPRLPIETVTDKIPRGAERFFRRSILFDPLIISEATVPFIAKNLEIFRPKFLAGYPSAIYMLAQYFKNQGAPHFELQAITTGNEQLYDQQKEKSCSIKLMLL